MFIYYANLALKIIVIQKQPINFYTLKHLIILFNLLPTRNFSGFEKNYAL